MSDILSIIEDLDSLPNVHEPEVDDLWEAIRRIQSVARREIEDEQL